jgi:hypothetical protein
VKLVKNIASILLGVIFLISSSGFLMYKSHCSCTGKEQVSVFVKSEICHDESMDSEESQKEVTCCAVDLINHIHSEESSCCDSVDGESCTSHDTDYDCDKTEVVYVKLQDQVVNEDIKFTKTEPVVIAVLSTLLTSNFTELTKADKIEEPITSPPPLINSSYEFLISIHQLKIPALA